MNDHDLARIYYDPKHPAGFSNVNKLWLASKKKIPRKEIQEWLMKQECYTRHKSRRKSFPRRSYIIDNLDDLWEADLIVFENGNLKKANDNICYILGK